MNSQLVKDKAFFVVTLLGAFLAFSSFKVELANTYIHIGDKTVNFLSLIILFIVLLTFSAYLYALDYFRYSLGKYQNFILFRAIIPLANFFYSLAILFPFIILLTWVMSISVIHRTVVRFNKILLIVDVVIAIISFFIGGFSAFVLTKKNRKDEIENIAKNKNNYLDKALRLFNNGFYGESILESYKVLELALQEKLLEEKNLYSKYTNMSQLAGLAFKNNILSEKFAPVIKELQIVRNQAAHSLKPFSREQAENVLNTVKSILEHKVETEIIKV